jgi:hypothetical protein
MKWFFGLLVGWRVSIARSDEKKEKKIHQNLVCLAMNMQSWLKNLYFIYGLQPNLTKSSYGWLSFF